MAIIADLPQHWKWGVGAFQIYRLLLSLWAEVLWPLNLVPSTLHSAYYFGHVAISDGLLTQLVGPWERWDTIHYARIASQGYVNADLGGFHPLFPLIDGALGSALKIQPIVALMLVANLSLCLALVTMYRLVESQIGAKISRATILTLLTFPSAFYLAAPYAESLTLLLILLTTLWAMEGRWVGAAMVGMAAGLGHSTSLPLVALLLVEAVRQGRGRARLGQLALLIAAVGPLIGNALFLAWRASRGFAGWGALHRDLWGVVLRWPWERLAGLGEVFQSPFFPIAGWANLLGLLLALGTGIWWLRSRPVSWAAHQAAMLIFLLGADVPGEPLASWIRHLVMLPPLFVALANATFRTRWGLLVLAAGAAAQLYLSALFMRWIWVA